MGLVAEVSLPLQGLVESLPTWQLALLGVTAFIAFSIVINVLKQLLFKNPNEPPVVFHLVPFIGSTISYGMEPFNFFFACKEKYGDVFTYILLGRKVSLSRESLNVSGSRASNW